MRAEAGSSPPRITPGRRSPITICRLVQSYVRRGFERLRPRNIANRFTRRASHDLRCAQRFRTPWRLIPYVATVLVYLSNTPCHASDPEIQIIPETTELFVSGRPASDGSLTGQVTLLSNQVVPELILRLSNLRQETGPQESQTDSNSLAQIQLITSLEEGRAHSDNRAQNDRGSGSCLHSTY